MGMSMYISCVYCSKISCIQKATHDTRLWSFFLKLAFQRAMGFVRIKTIDLMSKCCPLNVTSSFTEVILILIVLQVITLLRVSSPIVCSIL